MLIEKRKKALGRFTPGFLRTVRAKSRPLVRASELARDELYTRAATRARDAPDADDGADGAAAAKRAADGALREHRDFLAGLREAPCGPELGGLRAEALAPSPISMFMPAVARRELEKAIEASIDGGRAGEGVARGEPPPGHYVSKRAVTGRDIGFLEAQAGYARAGPELEAQLDLAARALARGEGVSEQARRLFHARAWREAEAAFSAALAHLEPALADRARGARGRGG